jgi:hypothetical protein
LTISSCVEGLDEIEIEIANLSEPRNSSGYLYTYAIDYVKTKNPFAVIVLKDNIQTDFLKVRPACFDFNDKTYYGFLASIQLKTGLSTLTNPVDFEAEYRIKELMRTDHKCKETNLLCIFLHKTVANPDLTSTDVQLVSEGYGAPLITRFGSDQTAVVGLLSFYDKNSPKIAAYISIGKMRHTLMRLAEWRKICWIRS